MGKVIKKLDDIPQFYLIETNKGIHWRNQQHILLDQGRNSSKSRTIDEYNSIIVTRTTNVTKQSSKHNTNNEIMKTSTIHLQSAHIYEDEWFGQFSITTMW